MNPNRRTVGVPVVRSSLVWFTVGVLGLAACGEPASEGSVGDVAAALDRPVPACVHGTGCTERRACLDLADGCDPYGNGTSCPGECVSCDDGRLQRTYAETSRRSCARVRIRCGDAQRPFNDPCGCGCEGIGPTPR